MGRMMPEVIAVKPTRGLVASWLGNMSRERRTALISLGILVFMLTSLVLYQRYLMADQPPLKQPDVDQPLQRGTPVEQDLTGPEAELSVATARSDTPVSAPVDTPLRLQAPIAGESDVMKAFQSLDETYGDFRFYGGIAYRANEGQAVLAAGSGTVIAVEQDPFDGTVVIVDHGQGVRTRYAGLGQVTVKEQAAVTQGALLAQVGTPGPARRSMPSHLQFQVFVNGEAVDPATYFSK